jgi:hypothetical protein
MSVSSMPTQLDYFIVGSCIKQNLESEIVQIRSGGIACGLVHCRYKNPRSWINDSNICFQQGLDKVMKIRYSLLDLNSRCHYYERDDDVSFLNTLSGFIENQDFAREEPLKPENDFAENRLGIATEQVLTRIAFAHVNTKVVLKQKRLILLQQVGLSLFFGVVIFSLLQIQQIQRRSQRQLTANSQVVFISYQSVNSVNNVNQENREREQLLYDEISSIAINLHDQEINSEIADRSIRRWDTKTVMSVDKTLRNTIYPVRTSLGKQHITAGNADAAVDFINDITKKTKESVIELVCNKNVVPKFPNKDDVRKWCEEEIRKKRRL